MVARSTATISDEYSEVPSDFLGVKSFAIGGERLAFLTPDQMESAAGARQAGTPRYFSIVGGEFRYYPIPSAGAEAVLTYWRTIPALLDTNPTNWVLANHPDAYLYGALLQAAPYVVNDARMATWGTLFTTVLDAIESSDAIESDTTLTSVPRVVV